MQVRKYISIELASINAISKMNLDMLLFWAAFTCTVKSETNRISAIEGICYRLEIFFRMHALFVCFHQRKCHDFKQFQKLSRSYFEQFIAVWQFERVHMQMRPIVLESWNCEHALDGNSWRKMGAPTELEHLRQPINDKVSANKPELLLSSDL